jgi:ABC-2 type transport system ATP-binding protein
LSAEQLATLEGVTKRFGSVQALNGLSLSVPEGSICGLLGPNGSGKTTAIRVLLGLSRADSGSARLLGAQAGSREFTKAVRQAGSLIEGPALYGRATARQNMNIQATALGLSPSAAGIDGLLEMVGLSGRSETNARGFSLGMKQRLGLAVSLIGNPRMVILDEPTNGLDPSGIVEIRELITRLPASGVTVLVSSHMLSEVQLMCDRATIISRGAMIADGTMDQILQGAGAGGGYRIRVRPDEIEGASRALVDVGLRVGDAGGGELAVSGPISDGSQINVLLAGSGIYASEIRMDTPDLEGVFLSLTADAGAPGGVVDAH